MIIMLSFAKNKENKNPKPKQQQQIQQTQIFKCTLLKSSNQTVKIQVNM